MSNKTNLLAQKIMVAVQLWQSDGKSKKGQKKRKTKCVASGSKRKSAGGQEDVTTRSMKITTRSFSKMIPPSIQMLHWNPEIRRAFVNTFFLNGSLELVSLLIILFKSFKLITPKLFYNYLIAFLKSVLLISFYYCFGSFLIEKKLLLHFSFFYGAFVCLKLKYLLCVKCT